MYGSSVVLQERKAMLHTIEIFSGILTTTQNDGLRVGIVLTHNIYPEDISSPEAKI